MKGIWELYYFYNFSVSLNDFKINIFLKVDSLKYDRTSRGYVGKTDESTKSLAF